MAIRFDGQVAVVTGAGGGLGRAYALLLAANGAKVLVNDLGSALSGDPSTGAPQSPADKVVAEIRALGGTAEADYRSVLDGAGIISHAVAAFGGRVDILINNAGVLRDVSFTKMTEKDWNLVLDVHVKGAFACTKAVWPLMQQQRYGRIVNTASAAGLYGNFGQANYSAAKSALIGFTKTLAFEGEKKNILVNCIAPLAGTRMTETVMPEELVKALKPEYIAPVVAFLCSRACQQGGQVLEVGAGWVASVRWQRNEGHAFQIPFKPDDVQRQWRKITDFTKNCAYPTSLRDSMIKHLKEAGAYRGSHGNRTTFSISQQVTELLEETAAKRGTSALAEEPSVRPPRADSSLSSVGTTAGADSGSKAGLLFRLMEAYLSIAAEERAKLQTKVDASFAFNIMPNTDGRKTAEIWGIDLRKKGSGSVQRGAPSNPDATFTIKESDFQSVCLNKLNPQMAFLQGKMKIKGNMAKASKFTPNLFPPISEEILSMRNADAAITAYLQANNLSAKSSSGGAAERERPSTFSSASSAERLDSTGGTSAGPQVSRDTHGVDAERPQEKEEEKISPEALKLKSIALYRTMKVHFETPAGKDLVNKIKSIYRVNILPRKGAPPVPVIIDLKNTPPRIWEETPGEAKATVDCTLTLLDEDFVKLAMGKMNPQLAFMQGKVKLKGSMQAAMKFTPSIFPKQARL